jgi:hypothetical protein
MTTIEPRLTTRPKLAKSPTSAKRVKSKPAGRSSSPDTASTKAGTGDPPHIARVTKHDRVLLLLSRKDGATIPEMMEATGWQQHSVRGFLAGTVKKKLGFALASSKTAGELRRYRIDTKRGR